MKKDVSGLGSAKRKSVRSGGRFFCAFIEAHGFALLFSFVLNFALDLLVNFFNLLLKKHLTTQALSCYNNKALILAA